MRVSGYATLTRPTISTHSITVSRLAPFQPALSAPVEHLIPPEQNQTATPCHRRAHRNRQGLYPALPHPALRIGGSAGSSHAKRLDDLRSCERSLQLLVR